MQEDRTEDIERGMALIPGIPEVMEDRAGPATRAIYEDVRQSLRVPFVNFLFRVLANEAAFLQAAWERVGPLARLRAFEANADRLRARALVDPVPALDREAAAKVGVLDEVRAYTDSIHYVLPKLLLCATTFDEVAAGRPVATEPAPGTRAETVPPGIAPGTTSLPMVDPMAASASVRELFQDITARHRHPGVATYYRGLAQWPPLLAAAWHQIRPLVSDALCEGRKRDLIDQADAALIRVHPLAGAAGAPTTPIPLDPEQRVRLRAILAVFRCRILPDLLVVVALVKAMLDGPDAALRSRFSVGDPD